MIIKTVPISEVDVWKDNPRNIKTTDFERLKRQIKELGVYKPLICVLENGSYITLGGNMRLLALRELGHKEIEVSVVKAKSQAMRIKYALSDNDRAGEYDNQALAELTYPYIEEINLEDYKLDVGQAMSLKDVIEEFGPDLDGEEDEVPKIDGSPAISKMGDLFTLGRHRLLCGDATKEEDTVRLMDGEKADMVFTDPPYGINYDPQAMFMHGPKHPKPKALSGMKNDDGTLDLSFLFDYEKRFIWGFPLILNIKALGWLVWDKHPGLEGESIGNPVEMASTSLWQGFRIVRCLWGGYYRAKGEERGVHPTQKPLGVTMPYIKEFGNTNQLFYDPFLGSGTTLIACEKLNRICYGMEIEPKYCDVIITRYCNYTDTPEEEIRATVEHGKG